jgi:poly-gamma-glutamate capsule biosynthesis protein CapA/YwtB (metallophosphatase superfamily)
MRSLILAVGVILTCAWFDHAALAQDKKVPVAASTHLTITLAGDTGLNPTNQTVSPKGVTDGGVFQTWDDTTAGIAASINGDVNFMNVETVVTDRNDLPPDLKGQSGPFNFRMHPNGLKHLVKIGFNVLSMANNHSMDYGPGGVLESLKHVNALRGNGVLASAGIGKNFEEASRTDVFEINGHTIAYAATGIITNDLQRHRAGENSPGQTSYRNPADFAEVRRRLVEAQANLRILSVHYGYEGYVRADRRQFDDFRGLAADKDGIDLIVGHHAHVVRGVEMRGKSVIFYGLGNFLHHGTANITAKGVCRDYGLFARVHLAKTESGALAIQAVEAVPVTEMHRKTRPLTGEAGQKRIHVLNYLAGTIDDNASGATGMRFTPQANGSGLYCVEGAETQGGKIGQLCKAYKPAPPVPASLSSTIASSCAR